MNPNTQSTNYTVAQLEALLDRELEYIMNGKRVPEWLATELAALRAQSLELPF